MEEAQEESQEIEHDDERTKTGKRLRRSTWSVRRFCDASFQRERARYGSFLTFCTTRFHPSDEKRNERLKRRSCWRSAVETHGKFGVEEIIRGEAHGKRATDAVEEATTLLFAGHDTQSATMCWGILELIKHEKIQEELRLRCASNDERK